jgi:hypothetical protein
MKGRKKTVVTSGVVRYTAFMQGITNVTALTVPGLCPFVLLIMVVWQQVRELGCEEGKLMVNGLFQYATQEMG